MCRWLTPVILTIQETEIRRITVQSQPRQIVHYTLSRKTLSQNSGLVEWLKVKTLSSSPSTTKKTERKAKTSLKLIHIYICVLCKRHYQENKRRSHRNFVRNTFCQVLMAHTCNPNYLKVFSLRPAQANRFHLQNNQNKMDWRYDSRSKVPTL
jgi:hypothetical protein